MAKVRLHIYDVTNGSENMNRTIVRINNILYGIGLGGIFHSAVQVYGDDEWSFGFSKEEGTGVFRCPAGKNKTFKFKHRKSLVLGRTNLSFFQVIEILSELSREWPGDSYDPLSKNCNHFCHQFCLRLGVPTFPGWVNRFANAGDVAREGVENTALGFQKAKTNILSASKVAYRFLFGVTNNVKTGLDSPNNNSNSGGSPRLQAFLLKNLSTKSSRCLSTRKRGEVELQQTRNKI